MNQQATTHSPGRNTEIQVQVRYTDCDPMSVAHHSVYPVWLEIAPTELLRAKGVAYRDLEERGVLFVVVKLSVSYKRPAKYDDQLRVRVWELGDEESGRRARIEHGYEVLRGDELLAEASTTLVCVNREGKPQAIPDWAIGSGQACP
jgi:acyl-CoA thioester hydrolase